MYFFTAFMLLLTILNILVYYLQKQHKDDDNEWRHSSLCKEEHDEKKDTSSSSSVDKQCRRFSLSEIKLATHDFDDAYVIGKGGFGKVYKGNITDFGEGHDVAIKRLNLDSNQGATEFWAEIEMLSKFRHTHIVSLLGYCEESSKREMILVYEYMPNGCLADHLHKRRADGSTSSPLTWVERLNICIGAARGLDYLHTGTGVQSRVIHRDIKSSNILLDENFSAKISDFGVSRIGPAYQLGTTTNVYTGLIRGTFGYMDAEYFSTHRLTRKSDVYAFGVVLFEVLCGRPALDFTLDEQQHSLAGWAKQNIREGNIGKIIDTSLKGQVSANCLKEFGQIAYECLRNCSKDRPTMTKVLARLEFVLAWTLRSGHSASDQKHIGRAILIEKAWSLFSTKAPFRVNSDTKKFGQSDDNKKKDSTMEKHASTEVESGDIATACEQVVPPNGKTLAPTLQEFTFSELQRATRNFKQDRVIGEGGFGKVYKGWLDSSTYNVHDKIAVAIKKSKPERFQGLEEWQAELTFLGNISHPNLVKLLGYCWNDDYFLVYEYMQNGSLENHLFRKDAKPLPWDTRIEIAIGAAQGLAFLHTKENNVMFRDFKSSNILLDEDFNAKLSDFGLAKLGPVSEQSHVTTRVMGTYGYAAPEYIATGHLYVKSDVFGFGVVMLEMITGLRAFDTSRPTPKRNLVNWATPYLSAKRKLRRIMDPRFAENYPSKGATKAAKLIVSCLESEPNNRPSMEEVVSALQVISAIKWTPNQSKSKANPSHSSNWHHQNHSQSSFGTKKGRGAWSTTNWLSGLRVLVGSKQDRTRMETDETKTEKWGHKHATNPYRN